MKKLLLLAFMLISSVAWANKPIKFVVPYTAGGSADRLARTLATVLSSGPYNFVIDYKLGAGGSTAANFVADTKNETVIMMASNALIGNPLITTHTKYDVNKDFVLVSYIGAEPLMVLVTAQSNITNFRDFVKQAQTRNLPYGSGGVGTSSHLMSAIVANNNKNLIHVPFKGGSAVTAELLAGRLFWVTESDAAMGTQIADNRLRPVAVYYKNRISKYPEVPTLRELGVDDRNFYRWHIIIANAAADPAVIRYIQDRLKDPAVKQQLEQMGLDTAQPDKFSTFFKDETEKMRRIVRDFSISE